MAVTRIPYDNRTIRVMAQSIGYKAAHQSLLGARGPYSAVVHDRSIPTASGRIAKYETVRRASNLVAVVAKGTAIRCAGLEDG